MNQRGNNSWEAGLLTGWTSRGNQLMKSIHILEQRWNSTRANDFFYFLRDMILTVFSFIFFYVVLAQR